MMLRSIVSSALALVLSACAMRSTVAPEEVLRKSTIANQAITSARYTLDADFTGNTETYGTIEGSADAEGVIQNGGRQFQVSFTADVRTTLSVPTEWSAAGEIVVADEREVYTKLTRLNIDPPHPQFSGDAVRGLIGTWWLMPSASGSTAPTNLTPDPRFLRMQTDVIEVVKDRGIISMDGRTVHHYDVVVDKEKLAAFMNDIDAQGGETSKMDELNAIDMRGELWIDTQNYVIRKAEWSIHSADAEKPLELNLTLNVTDHDSGVTVTPPSSALPIDLGKILLPTLPIVTPLE